MATKEKLVKELKTLKKKIRNCNTRIENTINPKTEQRIRRELEPLLNRKEKVDQELEMIDGDYPDPYEEDHNV